jgi:hypothetical protein
MHKTLSGMPAEVRDEIRDAVRQFKVIIRREFHSEVGIGTGLQVAELLCQMRDDLRTPVSGEEPLHDLDGALFMPLAEALETLCEGDTPSNSVLERVGRSRKTASEANARARDLARSFGEAFFAMSESAQARKIGCHPKTWRKTEFYKAAARQGKIKRRNSARSRPAVNLSDSILASNGNVQRKDRLHKERDAQLNKLIEEQEQDYEPSPVENDSGAKKRPRRHRKTV